MAFTIRTSSASASGIAAPEQGAAGARRGPVAECRRFHNPGLWGTWDRHRSSGRDKMLFILWLIAVVLVIGGIVTLVRAQVLFGILLIIVGLLVGPGGVSIFNK